MDFILGIIFVLLIIFLIINYTSISISNKNYNLENNETLYKNNEILYKNNEILNKNNILPFPKKKNTSINNKFNVEEQSYDYKSYFYI